MARAAGVSTSAAVRRFTIRRGSILRFKDDGRCGALKGVRCSVHAGRPLACRLYPLGLERDGDTERFVTLEPAVGSLGVYGIDGTVDEFLATQEVGAHLAAMARYAMLIPVFRGRIAELVDFERFEPREFWRRARREAMAESNCDPNRLIEALFDADRFELNCIDVEAMVDSHVRGLVGLIEHCNDAPTIAAAAVMLATSLGYLPDEVMP